MNKLDQQGFITAEWASMNIDGFDDLDPCCQQLVLLFPDVPVDCASTGLQGASKPPTPAFILDPSQVTMGIPPALALLPAGILLAGGGGDSGSPPPVSVPEPGAGMLLLLALGVSLLVRSWVR
jgi:hypothetical protein